MTIKPIISTIILLITANILIAQTSTNASGGLLSGANGYASYSVGEVFYGNGTDGSILEIKGIQQPYILEVVTGKDADFIQLTLSVFPNPANEVLNVVINEDSPISYKYEIYTINGEVFQNGKLNTPKSLIVLSQLPSSIYFMRIIDKGSVIKTFKIIKQ